MAEREAPRAIAMEMDERGATLSWEDGTRCELPWIWLRDNDVAELHPQTLERTFDLSSVELDVRPLDCELDSDGLSILWPGRDDASHYEFSWLSAHAPGTPRADAAQVQRQTWRADSAAGIVRADARECMESPQKLREALVAAKSHGLLLFQNLPDDPGAGEALGALVGFRRETNFGNAFEVINRPDPNNLAYTALKLELHTDLPNQESVPGYQFLYSCRNTVTGGESVFADGFAVCEDMARETPTHFRLLTETAIPWRFHDEDWDIRSRRPVITTADDGSLAQLVFNAHIADIPDLPADQLYPFYAAYRDLMQRVRDPRYARRHALREGEMVMFDNHRVLHGREAFDPASGERHYRGFYIEHNEVDSRIRVLSR